jgi:uncharacterized repeat protein (TIGR01451 family)
VGIVTHRLALLAATLAIVGPAPAKAACTAANAYNFAFNSVASASLNYANSYSYTASTTGGATQSFTVSFGTNGLSSSSVNGNAMPAIGSLITSGTGAKTLEIGGVLSSRTADITSATRNIRVTFTFATPIRDLNVTVHDIDYASNQYRDWLWVQGANGASTYLPSLVSPFGTNNAAGPYSTAPATSSVAFGNGYNSGGVNLTGTSAQAAGISTAANTGTNVGDVAISFAQPVTSVTIRYGNYPLTTGETTTGQQAYGISAVSFCPMPVLAIAKSSAPLATTGPTRFDSPGSDVVYTITATNSGGSPVDLNGLVLTDTLPAQAKFYDADFDPAQPGTDPFLLTAGASGVTLSAANVTYSSDGINYTYTPAAGYDANVKAVKFAPGGSLAANSSFTIQYRVQIK